MRIISTVPSQTELLHDLGLDDEVVGITKFCVEPSNWFKSKTRIGGTKTLDLEKIISLKPDLIIANKEENEKEQINELQKQFEVVVTDVPNLMEAYQMIMHVGSRVGKMQESAKLISDIQFQFEQNPSVKRGTAIYLIWKDPYMTVGGDTFISDMLFRARFENLTKDRSRYPEIGLEEMIELDPQHILLSSEPYPFKAKHIDELKTQLPNANIQLVDGMLFSWYGSRLLKAPKYFSRCATSNVAHSKR